MIGHLLCASTEGFKGEKWDPSLEELSGTSCEVSRASVNPEPNTASQWVGLIVLRDLGTETRFFNSSWCQQSRDAGPMPTPLSILNVGSAAGGLEGSLWDFLQPTANTPSPLPHLKGAWPTEHQGPPWSCPPGPRERHPQHLRCTHYGQFSPSVKCYYFPCTFNSNILSRQWKPGPTQAWPVSRRNRRSRALCVGQGFFLPLSICQGGPRGCGEWSPELSPRGVAEEAQDPKLHCPPCLNG